MGLPLDERSLWPGKVSHTHTWCGPSSLRWFGDTWMSQVSADNFIFPCGVPIFGARSNEERMSHHKGSLSTSPQLAAPSNCDHFRHVIPATCEVVWGLSQQSSIHGPMVAFWCILPSNCSNLLQITQRETRARERLRETGVSFYVLRIVVWTRGETKMNDNHLTTPFRAFSGRGWVLLPNNQARAYGRLIFAGSWKCGGSCAFGILWSIGLFILWYVSHFKLQLFPVRVFGILCVTKSINGNHWCAHVQSGSWWVHPQTCTRVYVCARAHAWVGCRSSEAFQHWVNWQFAD